MDPATSHEGPGSPGRDGAITAPIIQPVLFKTTVYWAVVFVVRFLEKIGEYFFAGRTFAGIPDYVMTHFTWHRFAAIQIWIFVLFLIYTSVAELNAALSPGQLRKIFFNRRSAETKPTPSVADYGTGAAERL